MNQITSFLQEVVSELKKVNWPTRQETLKMTLIVIITTIIVGIYIGATDFALTKGLERFVR